PSQPARSSDPASAIGLRGVWVVRRADAPTPYRGVLRCPKTSARGRSNRAPRPSPRPSLANLLLLIAGRERFPSRRGSLSCCDGRAASRSRPSWNPLAGSRTRCVGSLLAWSARSLGSRLPPRRPTAAVFIGSLAQDPLTLTPPLPSRAPDHAAALARAGRDRGRDRSYSVASARCAAAAVAADVRTRASCWSE